jgi:hypothetical protein
VVRSVGSRSLITVAPHDLGHGGSDHRYTSTTRTEADTHADFFRQRGCFQGGYSNRQWIRASDLPALGPKAEFNGVGGLGTYIRMRVRSLGHIYLQAASVRAGAVSFGWSLFGYWPN